MVRKSNSLDKLGFGFSSGGVHLARTLMLAEVVRLFDFLPEQTVEKQAYMDAIIVDNCLSKRSVRSRKLTARHLSALYGLDDQLLLFRAFKFFWYRAEAARPQLALLITYARDGLFRESTKYILGTGHGKQILQNEMKDIFSNKFPDRFSEATLKSMIQNISSSWTQAGYLSGRVKKVRSKTEATEAAVSLALLLAYLRGFRGDDLFNNEYVQLLDCLPSKALSLVESASRKGWVIFKRVGTVIEVAFPSLMNEQDMEWAREQA